MHAKCPFGLDICRGPHKLNKRGACRPGSSRLFRRRRDYGHWFWSPSTHTIICLKHWWDDLPWLGSRTCMGRSATTISAPSTLSTPISNKASSRSSRRLRWNLPARGRNSRPVISADGRRVPIIARCAKSTRVRWKVRTPRSTKADRVSRRVKPNPVAKGLRLRLPAEADGNLQMLGLPIAVMRGVTRGKGHAINRTMRWAWVNREVWRRSIG